MPAQSLTPREIACFQALVKPAIVLLLMLRMSRPCGARELADILGLDEHTVAKYLRQLGVLNLVIRARQRRGYHLVGNPLVLLMPELTGKKLQFSPSSTADLVNLNKKIKDQLTTVVDPNLTVYEPESCAAPGTIEALLAAGIGEPKRSALARLAYLTPEFVQDWQARLKYLKGEDYRTGLLIHVLETGDPPPEVRSNGHLVECDCRVCNPPPPILCPECNARPCYCDELDFD